MLSTALVLPWAWGALLVAFDGRRPVIAWLAVATLAANLAMLVVLTVDVLRNGSQQIVTGGWPAGVGIVLRADTLGVTFALLSVLVLLAAAAAEAIIGVRERTLPGLVLLLAGGLTGLFLTADVFNFYVFFELAMTASYALTTYGGQRRQLRAALVFTAVNLLGSFIFLLSVAGTYRVTGTLAMADVAERIVDVSANAAMLVAVGFFIAFSVKLGLFPFHFWLPTVYAGTRPAVAAILSGAVANIGAYGLLRFGAGIFPDELRRGATVLVLLGAASIIYGAVLAVSRGDAAEMLAYSAIGQVGYVLVAVGVGGPVGLAAAVLYSVVNSLNKTLLFLASGLRGALVAGTFAVGALSVAGVPPAAGFVGKLEMFRTAIAAGSPALVLLLVIGSALSLVYLFQVYQHRFWHTAPSGAGPISPLPLRALTAGLALLVLAVGLWPEPLLTLSGSAAQALLTRRSG
ncbi:complex I subunit 5 family protein [Pseudonocardia sp. H11422]|uniref:complex I subunit 5 family protein n=1 Tax=Pseudonocardia sp. H11422 TaxID=2835866 RepID=UPI001BDC78DA|nr:proton-conducting transporter membrane subunit [Pseudonocardia sp. H11422]